MAENNNGAKLTIVPNPEAVREPSTGDLIELAKNEFAIDLTIEELDLPETAATREMLSELWQKRMLEAAQAEAEKIEQEKREVREKKLKELNGKLFGVLHPPKKEEILDRAQITALLPKREPTAEDRLAELKKEYGHLLPGWAFDHESHEGIMGIRGYLIDVLIRFKRYMKNAPDAEYKKSLDDKCRALQNRIDIVSEIVQKGYLLDPAEASSFCSPDSYKDVRAKIAVDDELTKLCTPPETPTEREARRQCEAMAAIKRAAAAQEREQMVADLMVHMLLVPYFEKLGNDAMEKIAERIARKFDGNTPESRLKQAALEKRGAEKGENRTLGIALAQAAGLSVEQINQMFPFSKGKKEKK